MSKKESLKIAIVVKYFPTVTETFIVNQINGLMEAGYSVQLYAYKQGNTKVLHDSFKKHGLLNTVTYFVSPPVSKLRRLLVFVVWVLKNVRRIKWPLLLKSLNVFKHGKDAYTLKLFFESQWFLVRNSIKLIHAHFGMNGNRMAYLKAKGIIPASVPLLVTFHGYDLLPNQASFYKTHYTYLLKECSAFTVNTLYLESLLREINIYNKPCHVLPVGLDTSYFKRQFTKGLKETFNLLFCGTLIPLKGADIAIEVLENLHKKGFKEVRLHIVGDGPMRLALQDQVDSLGLAEKVIFYGSQSQEEIRSIMETMDLFLLPGRKDSKTGRTETQGLVIQEAQAMELPVVVSDVGGMKYGLIPNETGFVVKENDLEDFLKILESLLNNPKLIITMGQKGREFVVENYDVKNVVNKLLNEVYKNLINNSF